MENVEWTEVTPDEWSDFLVQFKCYGTEPTSLALMHRHSETQEPLGLIVYESCGPGKKYYINKQATSPKII